MIAQARARGLLRDQPGPPRRRRSGGM